MTHGVRSFVFLAAIWVSTMLPLRSGSAKKLDPMRRREHLISSVLEKEAPYYKAVLAAIATAPEEGNFRTRSKGARVERTYPIAGDGAAEWTVTKDKYTATYTWRPNADPNVQLQLESFEERFSHKESGLFQKVVLYPSGQTRDYRPFNFGWRRIIALETFQPFYSNPNKYGLRFGDEVKDLVIEKPATARQRGLTSSIGIKRVENKQGFRREGYPYEIFGTMTDSTYVEKSPISRTLKDLRKAGKDYRSNRLRNTSRRGRRG